MILWCYVFDAMVTTSAVILEMGNKMLHVLIEILFLSSDLIN